jgi:hypothetical protein
MDQLELKNRLDVAARAGAIMLVALYGAGFLVVSFHNALYGIVEFGLFRTKLLSAGIVFAIFFGIPFWESSHIFGLFGLQAWILKILERDQNLEPSPLFKWSLQTLVFFSTAAGICFFLRILLADLDFSLRGVLAYLVIASIAPAVIMPVAWGNVRSRAARICLVIAAFGVIVLFLVGLMVVHQWTFLVLFAWFVMVGSLARQMNSPIREPKKLLEVNWHLSLLNLVGLFGLFAGFIYPKIKPAFGGGQPTHVVLQFANASPVDNSAKMDVLLVDETDGGYYFIRTPEDRKAIFVPKSLVAAVYFQVDKSVL